MQRVEYDYPAPLTIDHVISALRYAGLVVHIINSPTRGHERLIIEERGILTPEADEYAESVGA
jgi:hypothetical protein